MYKRKSTVGFYNYCTEDDQKFDPASGRGPAYCRNHMSESTFPAITTEYAVDSCSIVPPRLT